MAGSSQAERRRAEEPAPESGPRLLKTRLVFYALGAAHLCWLAAMLLPVDLSDSSDRQLLVMSNMRHLLYTALNNYFQLMYLPLCLYVDWKEYRGQHLTPRVRRLRIMRNALFTAIVLPTTLYVCSLFWRVWNIDRDMVVPRAFDEQVPTWMHHNLHTVTALVCLADLCLVPRYKPSTSHVELGVLHVFCTFYTFGLMYHNDVTGDWLYPFLYGMSPWRIALFIVSFFVEHWFFYFSQWLVTEMIWGTRLMPVYKVKVTNPDCWG